MSLVFIDGFENWATANWALKWNSLSGLATVVADKGRAHGKCLEFWTSTCYVSKELPGMETFIIGYATTFTSAFTGTLLKVNYGGTTTTAINLNYTTSTSIFTVTRASDSVVLGTVTVPITALTWCFLEFKVKLHPTTGSFSLRINAVEVLNVSNINTFSSAVDVTGFTSGCWGTGGYFWMDDLYVCNALGTVNNDFLGDIKITTYAPNANGTYNDFVGSDSDSTNNYLLVDDATTDTDTTYVQAITVGAMDSYNYPGITLAVSEQILGVSHLIVAKKTASDPKGISSLARSNSTDYLDAEVALGTSYAGIASIHEVDPNTGSAWTAATLNAAEFGYKVIT